MKVINVLLMSVLAVSSFSSIAKQAPYAQELPYIQVTGKAVTQVVPDILYWQLEVKNEGRELSSVAQQHSELVTKVINLLVSFDLDNDHIQTTNMRFNEKFRYDKNNRVSDGYYASTSIRFKLVDLSLYQQIWQQLADVKEVAINSVNYDVHDRIAIQDATRIKALLAAKQKAQTLAETLGSQLGRPLAIEEPGTGAVFNRSANVMSMKMESADSGSSALAAGKISIEMSINAKFSLLP